MKNMEGVLINTGREKLVSTNKFDVLREYPVCKKIDVLLFVDWMRSSPVEITGVRIWLYPQNDECRDLINRFSSFYDRHLGCLLIPFCDPFFCSECLSDDQDMAELLIVKEQKCDLLFIGQLDDFSGSICFFYFDKKNIYFPELELGIRDSLRETGEVSVFLRNDLDRVVLSECKFRKSAPKYEEKLLRKATYGLITHVGYADWTEVQRQLGCIEICRKDSGFTVYGSITSSGNLWAESMRQDVPSEGDLLEACKFIMEDLSWKKWKN